MQPQFITCKMGEGDPPCRAVDKNLPVSGRTIYKLKTAVGCRFSFTLKHFLFLQVNYTSQNYSRKWQSLVHFEGPDNVQSQSKKDYLHM